MDWRTFHVPPCPTCLLQGRTETIVRTWSFHSHAPGTVAHPPPPPPHDSSSPTSSSLASRSCQKSRLARMSSANTAYECSLKQFKIDFTTLTSAKDCWSSVPLSPPILLFGRRLLLMSPLNVLTKVFSFPNSIVLCNMH